MRLRDDWHHCGCVIRRHRSLGRRGRTPSQLDALRLPGKTRGAYRGLRVNADPYT